MPTPTDNKCQPVAKNIPKRKGSGPIVYREIAAGIIINPTYGNLILFEINENRIKQNKNPTASISTVSANPPPQSLRRFASTFSTLSIPRDISSRPIV